MVHKSEGCRVVAGVSIKGGKVGLEGERRGEGGEKTSRNGAQ